MDKPRRETIINESLLDQMQAQHNEDFTTMLEEAKKDGPEGVKEMFDSLVNTLRGVGCVENPVLDCVIEHGFIGLGRKINSVILELTEDKKEEQDDV